MLNRKLIESLSINAEKIFKRNAIKEAAIDAMLKGVKRNTPILKEVIKVRHQPWSAWANILAEGNEEFAAKMRKLYVLKLSQVILKESQVDGSYEECEAQFKAEGKSITRERYEDLYTLDENLIDFAKFELKAAGMLNLEETDDAADNWDNLTAEAVLELIEVFNGQDHSGFSAQVTVEVFQKLAKYQPLSELTDNPEEWMDIAETSGGHGMWQSRRNPSVFSEDAGEHYYNLDDTNEDGSQKMVKAKHYAVEESFKAGDHVKLNQKSDIYGVNVGATGSVKSVKGDKATVWFGGEHRGSLIDVFVKSLSMVGERSMGDDGVDICPGMGYEDDKPKQGFKDMAKEGDKVAKKAQKKQKKQLKKGEKGTHDRK
jgi:hypothetical protein